MTQDPDINFWLKDAPVTQPTVGQEAEPMGVEATVTLTLGGELTDIDASIAPLVQALNAAGLMTIASCSGHAQRPGCIALKDGRELFIARNFEEARRIDRLFPFRANGEPALTPKSSESALLEEALEALKPFADESENYDYGDGSGPDLKGAPDASSLNELNDLTVGDLRRARAIRAKAQERMKP